MGQIKANIKPEYSIKEHERYAWVWRCVRLTNIPGQPRQDIKEWNYVAFNEQDHLRFKENFRAANVHEAFLIHDGSREKVLARETKERIIQEKAAAIEAAQERAAQEIAEANKREAERVAAVKATKERSKTRRTKTPAK